LHHVAGANLVEAVALHPVEGLTDATVAALADLFLAQEAGTCRQSAIALAEAAGGTAFALTMRTAGWTASTEPTARLRRVRPLCWPPGFPAIFR
jgi:hypothetical protein